jgi:acetyl-CoA carboxylase biotin carboxyl carrier protein
MPTQVQAPLTGTVWKVEVKVGDQVAEGQTVIILESMKMEMPVEAPAPGIVESVVVKPGDAVDEGAVLVTLA